MLTDLAYDYRSRISCSRSERASRKPGAREHQLRVLLDGLRLRGQVDLVVRQPPQDRRDGRIHQRELVREEVGLDLEQVGALQDGVAQDLLQLHRLLLVRLGVDLARQRVPVALDAIQRQAELRARHRIDRHQRRVREALIQVLDDDARVVEHQVAVHQRRHAVVGIQVEQVLREAPGLDTDDVDADALLREHDPGAMAPRVARGGEQRHDGSSARQIALLRPPLTESAGALPAPGRRPSGRLSSIPSSRAMRAR